MLGAIRGRAASKQGPRFTGAKFIPTLLQTGADSVKVSFGANSDRDDKTMSYQVVRNSNTGAPVKTMTADSTFWK